MGSPKLSGHLMAASLVILLPCSSTSRARGPSPTQEKSKTRFIVEVALDLAFKEVLTMNYLHLLNHLMEIPIARHMQMNLVTVSVMKVARTCSLTRRMETSQSQR